MNQTRMICATILFAAFFIAAAVFIVGTRPDLAKMCYGISIWWVFIFMMEGFSK